MPEAGRVAPGRAVVTGLDTLSAGAVVWRVDTRVGPLDGRYFVEQATGRVPRSAICLGPDARLEFLLVSAPRR